MLRAASRAAAAAVETEDHLVTFECFACKKPIRGDVRFNYSWPNRDVAQSIQRPLEEEHVLVADDFCVLSTHGPCVWFGDLGPWHTAGSVALEDSMRLTAVITNTMF